MISDREQPTGKPEMMKRSTPRILMLESVNLESVGETKRRTVSKEAGAHRMQSFASIEPSLNDHQLV